MTDPLSRYQVVRPLGSGGMGEVFLAQDSHLSRSVALKLLSAETSGDRSRRQRFVQEARAAAALNHPNICTVFDVGESEDGRIFITMEYVEGNTLGETLNRQQTELDELLDLAIQTAEAIEEAHSKGIVHRDLKPANIMLTPRGRVKIVDFGLARMTTLSTDHQDFPTDLHTAPGAIVGTIPYMSPEQLLGKEVDHRSDLFSFGIILYQLASGRHPFTGRSQVEIIDGLIHEDPPQLDRAQSPQELDRIIRKCLAKEREDRYQTATDLLVDLRALRRTQNRASIVAQPADAPPQHNLPLRITTFVGRQQELDDLNAILNDHRLTTITGPAGVGKTRLAIKIASRRLERHPHGVWFVDLAQLEDPSRVVPAIAAVLQIREAGDRGLLQQIIDALHERNLLLILDNCEHLVDEAARVAAALVQAVPHVHILATSREALSVAGECSWSVPPLAVPRSSSSIGPQTAEAFDAVRLFADRARSVQPRFVLSEANLEAVLDICRELDGIPLAIELAAARIRVMSPEEISNRLGDAFRLLTGGSREGLRRQQTLRAAVDWSYGLLTEAERALFLRLSVFHGGFDLSAAEDVCSFGEIERYDVVDLLGRLVDKSLVVAEHRPDGAVRHRLLEPLRQYAAEKISAGADEEEARSRHFRCFCALADESYSARVEAEGLWLERLELEHENLRAALRWAAEHDPEGALRLAGAVAWFWHLHAHYTEGREYLRRVLDGDRARTRETARALWGASLIGHCLGDRDASRQAVEESVAIWREIGERRELALALEAMGWSRWFGGDNPGALECFEECLRIHEELGNERLINVATNAICQVLVSEWDVARARPLAQKVLASARAQRVPRDMHSALHFLADCALIEGDFAAAEQLYAQSLRAVVSYGEPLEEAFEMEGVAMSVAAQGRHEKALRLSGAAHAVFEAINANISIHFWDVLVDRHLGAAATAAGEDAGRLREEGRRMGFAAATDYALALDRD